MSHKRAAGSIFVETTITAEVYDNIIQQFTALLRKDECDAVFQQDNALPNVAKDTISFVVEFFGERICKLPPCSPGFRPLNFFLWSFLKDIGYKDAPRSTAELKEKIENTIRITDTTFANLLKGAFSYLANETGHSADFL